MPHSALTRKIPRPSSRPCAASSPILHWQSTYARVHYSVLRNSAGARQQQRHSQLTRKHWQGVKNNMRVLMISKALVAGTSQRKLEELAKCPGVELTLITPPYWQSDDGSKQVLERLYTSGYQMIVTPMRLNNKQKAKALFFTWQNLYRNYPPPFRYLELYNYRHAAAALAGNRDAAEVLRRKGDTGPISIIPQFGFDTDIYQRSEPRQPRAPGDPFTLGFVGRLKDNKGLDLLVAALPELPHYCRLVFIGNGPMKEHLVQQAQRLGVVERVILKGGLPTYEIPREMQQLDALVLPSVTRPNWIEQFGRVLPAAMACETPVIGSSSGEIPHVIDDAGLVFEEGNVQELVACIRQLLDDPELYAQLAAKGRQRVLENYTQEQIARQTYKVYQQMLA